MNEPPESRRRFSADSVEYCGDEGAERALQLGIRRLLGCNRPRTTPSVYSHPKLQNLWHSTRWIIVSMSLTEIGVGRDRGGDLDCKILLHTPSHMVLHPVPIPRIEEWVLQHLWANGLTVASRRSDAKQGAAGQRTRVGILRLTAR